MTSSSGGAASGAVLCLIVALASTGCGQIGAQSAADDAAASYADHVLLRVLNEAADSAEPGQRMSAVERQLASPSSKFFMGRGDASWVVSQAGATEVSVTVYLIWVDKSFASAQATGIACREYTVGASVTVQAIECPKDTPQTPGPDAVWRP